MIPVYGKVFLPQDPSSGNKRIHSYMWRGLTTQLGAVDQYGRFPPALRRGFVLDQNYPSADLQVQHFRHPLQVLVSA